MAGSTLEAEALEAVSLTMTKLQKRKKFLQESKDATGLDDVINLVQEIHGSKSGRRRHRAVEKFGKCCDWLHQLSGVIDVVVQTEASIGSPIWVPIKLIVQVGI